MRSQLALLVLAVAVFAIGEVHAASTMITTDKDGSINCDGLKCPPGNGVRCEVNSSTLNGQGTVTRNHKKTTALVLCYWPEDTFDPSMLTMFERLERLRLSDSNITEVLDFPYHEHLQELVLSGLGLTWVGDDIFMGLRRLRVLDLSRNLLSSLDRTCVLRLPSLQQLLLAGELPYHEMP
ncbi:hypothetical protein FOCC_FOCC011897 [Frankliniella occidentalis]|nr:hypothetical protein FOCC_FOCC011897 [Frankliniella occidentalis]